MYARNSYFTLRNLEIIVNSIKAKMAFQLGFMTEEVTQSYAS